MRKLIWGVLLMYNIGAAQAITEDAIAIKKNKIQLESSVIIEKYSIGGEEITHWVFPSVLLRYGINHNVELRFATAFEGKKHIHRFEEGELGNLELGFKIHLMDSPHFNLSMVNHLLFPSRINELKENKVNAISAIILSQDITSKMQIGASIQYVFEEAQRRDINYSLILNHTINEKWNTYIETFGELLSKELISNIDTGLSYRINDYLEWQISYGTNFIKKYHFASTGMVWQIK